ncbi:MAG: hypothetical protein MUC76_12170 [Spirochaetes bacterium]|nr:hypothetical protein [Spirochaetota bacterium]
MKTLHCVKEKTFTDSEKDVFAAHLVAEGISKNVWNIFDEWVRLSERPVDFFYLKAKRGSELAGLGLFLKIKPVDLRTSYAVLRKNAFRRFLGGGISVAAGNCLYISLRNLITANLTRPFFYADQSSGDEVMNAMLAYLKNEKEADMVTIIDTLNHDACYRSAGFAVYDSSSEAILDTMKYRSAADFLAAHKSLKKNLAKKKITVMADVCRGPVSETDRLQMKACVENSIDVSNVNNPCQSFYEKHIFNTEAFTSDDYVHIMVRVDGVIAGFHTYLVSGSSLGGVLGGFNRALSRNHFAYERVIIASLEYARAHGLTRVNYSLIDNLTKLRLVGKVEPCALYFYSRSGMNRKVFDATYRFNDVFNLAKLEKSSGK